MYIPPDEVLSTSNLVQVDHVLPRSRSQDNSYTNQVLCFATANQDKAQRTPWEWRGEGDRDWWATFETRIKALHIKGFKKRTLLLRDFAERQGQFVARNLNDTRYVARALFGLLANLYPDEGDPAAIDYLDRPARRLFARPGGITALLRRAWGLADVKDRADDRHHALDAMMCAAARSEWLLNRLTLAYQRQEQENRKEWTPKVAPPWPGFRDDILAAYDRVFVARSERRRGRGAGHAETIYQIGEDGGHKVTYERKAIEKLTRADLDRIKDPAGAKRTVDALRTWIDEGKPKDRPPVEKHTDRDVPIRKVRLRRGRASGQALNGGHVDNADMVRVDVFAKDGKNYLVPIYTHQVMNPAQWPKPPNRAIVAYKDDTEWIPIDTTFEFRFSLYPDSYIEVVKRTGEILEGYYRSTDRSTGAIAISPHNGRGELNRGIGAQTLASFRKLQIDRLGRKHAVRRETRTWHGVACT